MIYDEINIENKISSSDDMIKKSLDNTLKPYTHKKDNKLQGYLYPLIPIRACKHVIDNFAPLNAVIRVLSSDVTLNEFSFYISNDPQGNFPLVDEFWLNNKNEFAKAVSQYLGFGFGALEILFDAKEPNKPAKLRQIPSETILIKQKRFGEFTYNYAEYNSRGTKKLFRITREDYDNISPFDDKSVGYVIWLGGDTESNWYTKPFWSSAYLDILTAMKKKELDYKVISSGNIPKGVLFIKAPPANSEDGEESVYDSLKSQFRDSAGGVAISYLETPMNDTTLTTEYVNIQEDNYDYLNDLIDRTTNLILTLYRVPKARLMIDDSRESMNSNKTQTLYEIYTLDLETYQYPIEQEINTFNADFFNCITSCDIKTPNFADTKETKVNTIINIYSCGIITLKQAIDMITSLYPEFDWSDVDFNDPELNQRFYHGMLFSTPGVDTGMSGILVENMRGGFNAEENYNPDATPEEQHIPPRSLFGR